THASLEYIMSGAPYLSRCGWTADLKETRSGESCAPPASPSRKRCFQLSERAPTPPGQRKPANPRPHFFPPPCQTTLFPPPTPNPSPFKTHSLKAAPAA